MSAISTVLKQDGATKEVVKRGLDPNEVLGIYPNKWQRKFLAERWLHMTQDERVVLRASRTKRGIKCYICGSPGVFRENCPNGCQSPPTTPRSDDSDESSDEEEKAKLEEEKKKLEEEALEKAKLATAGPKGIFWGTAAAAKAQEDAPLTIYEMKQKLDFVKLRVESKSLTSTMREKDKETVKGDFAFFEQAKESYARNAAELTLHQLMRRMMRLIEKELLQNAEKLESNFDSTLLVPPFVKEGKTFYPEEFLKNAEYRDYFFKKTANKGVKKAHQNQAKLRPMDDLDCLFRGESTSTDFLYKTKANAGESIHAKNTWKSIYGRYDGLANSDPSLAAKQRKLDKIFHESGEWIRLQKQNMEFRNDRFEHLIFILRREIEKEHEREKKVLLTDTSVHGNAAKDSAVDVFQDRLQAVDVMTHVLETYKFTAGGEEADFLLYCMRQWQDISQKRKVLGVRKSQVRHIGGKKRQKRSQVSENGSNDNANGNTTNNKATRDDTDTSDEDDDDDDDDRTHSHDDQDEDNSSRKHGSMANGKDGISSKRSNSRNNNHNNSATMMLANAENNDPDAFLQNIHRAAEEDKKQKAIVEQKRKEKQQQKQHGMRDLVAAENPYHLDMVFLDEMKKKDQRLLERGKTGQVFTAQGLRAAEAENEKKRNERKKALESMDLTSTGGVVLEGDKDSHSNSKGPAAALPLPSLDDIMSMAKTHSERVSERDERLRKQQERFEEKSQAHNPKVAHHFVHPREVDALRIRQREDAFRHAELGNRIRKGNDDDHAHALPALIPIPQAFDGNSQSVSYTAQNIIFGLKKDMVLSDLGYSPQTAVPLYVRTTLVEKEGTSKNGDPTQEELALDRRYSHYLGRPMIRFNNPAASTLTDGDKSKSNAAKAKALLALGENGTIMENDEELLEDLTALNFISASPHKNNHHIQHQHQQSLAATSSIASLSGAESLYSVPLMQQQHSLTADSRHQQNNKLHNRSEHPKFYLPPRDHHHPQPEHHPAPVVSPQAHSYLHDLRSVHSASSAAASSTTSSLASSTHSHHNNHNSSQSKLVSSSSMAVIPVRQSSSSSSKHLPSSSSSIASSSSSHASMSSQGLGGMLVLKKSGKTETKNAVEVVESNDKQKLTAEDKQRLKFEKKYNPLTKSLVRMVFTNPQPTLDDLKYLDEDF